MSEQTQGFKDRTRLWWKQRPGWGRMALIGALIAAVGALFVTPFSGAIAGPLFQAQPTPTPGPAAEVAVIAITEEGGSGFHGTAYLRSDGRQTELVVGIIPPSPPLIPILGQTQDDIGNLALYNGFCGLLQDSVEDLGPLTPTYAIGADEERMLHAMRTTLDMGLDELLTSERALVLLQREEGEPGQATPTPAAAEPGQQEQPAALACGTLDDEARLP